MVVLPGWSMNVTLTAHDTEPYFQGRTGWKRIYIDPPGHGKTPGMDWITDQDKMLEVILACIEKLTEGRNFALIGISLGAYLARGVIYHRAQSVDGIAMIVPIIVAEDEKRTVPPYQVLVEDQALNAELTDEEADFLGMSVVRSRKWLEYLRSSPHVPEHDNGDAAFLGRIREHPEKYAFSFDVDNPSKPFPGPTLILTGRQDSIAGYRDAWKILENYPRASYLVLDRMGHFQEESGDLIKVLVNNWLDRMDEGTDRT